MGSVWIAKVGAVAMFLGWWLTVHSWGAQNRTNAIISVPSISGQFLVYGVPIIKPPDAKDAAKAAQVRRLDPGLLAVSCENIKKALLIELRAADQWKSRISLLIQFTTAVDRPIIIQADHFTGNWRYRLELPDEVEINKLTRAIVNALLLEIGNRNAQADTVEIPLWLTEGFTQFLLAFYGRDQLLPQPFSRVIRQELKLDPVQAAHLRLRSHKPLTFTQLSLPTPEQLQGPAWEDFQVSSQLFIMELLSLKGGPMALREMLWRLPERLNWQMAFLTAFRSHFQSILEVEKWWELVLASGGSRVQLQGWTPAASLDKLDEILKTPVQIRPITNSLASFTTLSLQKFLELWDYPTQKSHLLVKMQQLRGLLLTIAPSIRPTAEAYLATLEAYVHKRSQLGYENFVRGPLPPSPRRLIREFSQELDALDARREVLRRRLAPPASPTSPETVNLTDSASKL